MAQNLLIYCPFDLSHPLLVKPDVAFLCVVKTQQRGSKKIYKTELTKIRYKVK